MNSPTCPLLTSYIEIGREKGIPCEENSITYKRAKLARNLHDFCNSICNQYAVRAFSTVRADYAELKTGLGSFLLRRKLYLLHCYLIVSFQLKLPDIAQRD